jgi:hypothetical protein
MPQNPIYFSQYKDKYMDTSTFCILDYAYEVFIPIQWLAYPSDLQDTLNKPFHGIQKENIPNVLYQLFLNDYIMIEKDPDLVDDDFTPSLLDLSQAISHPFISSNPILYGLTEKGGSIWEKVSNMDWNDYIHELYGGHGDIRTNEGEIITTTQSLTKQVLNERRVQKVLFDEILEGSERWSILTPWQATYWKILPVGHRVQFQYIL